MESKCSHRTSGEDSMRIVHKKSAAICKSLSEICFRLKMTERTRHRIFNERGGRGGGGEGEGMVVRNETN